MAENRPEKVILSPTQGAVYHYWLHCNMYIILLFHARWQGINGMGHLRFTQYFIVQYW